MRLFLKSKYSNSGSFHLKDWDRDEGFGVEIFDGELSYSDLLPFDIAKGRMTFSWQKTE